MSNFLDELPLMFPVSGSKLEFSLFFAGWVLVLFSAIDALITERAQSKIKAQQLPIQDEQQKVGEYFLSRQPYGAWLAFLAIVVWIVAILVPA